MKFHPIISLLASKDERVFIGERNSVFFLVSDTLNEVTITGITSDRLREWADYLDKPSAAPGE